MKIFEKNKTLKNVIFVVMAYLSSLSFSHILRLGKTNEELFNMLDNGLEWFNIFIFLVGIFLIKRYEVLNDKKIKCFSFYTGFILSFLTVWGTYALYINDIFISVRVFLIQVLLTLGLNIIITPAITEVFVLFKKFSVWDEKNNHSYSRKNNFLYFMIIWMIIFLCYIPVFLGFWPGNFIYDAAYQMSEVIHETYKTHHPLIHTWLMGKAYRIGLEWGNVSKGFQLYTLLQMLVLSSSFAYCLLYFRKKGIPKLFRIITLLWFALFPLNSVFSITATKDVLFAAFFLYTMIFFIRYFYDKEKFHWYTYGTMILFGILSALFRNNTIYAIVVFSVVCIIMTKGWIEKGKSVLILLSICIIAVLSNHLLIEGLNAYPGAKNKESLSVPLQGLARVAAYRGDELYEYQYNEICTYIEENTISSYNPFLADPIKNEANEKLLENNKLNFFKMWAKVGIQYPDEYIESFISNTMGYWYLFPMKDYVTMNLYVSHNYIGVKEEIEKVSFCDIAEKNLFSFFSGRNYRYIPVIGYLFRVAPYIWFMLFTMIWSIMCKNKKAILVMMLPLLYFGTCLLGPTVAIRYVYCLIVCCPLWFYLLRRRK